MSKALMTKKIIEILDGDTILAIEDNIEFAMPYLSGPNICDIGVTFGAQMEYDRKCAYSRWEYMQELLNFCIENNFISKLFSFLFNKTQFAPLLTRNYSVPTINLEEYVKKVKQLAIDNINNILSLSDQKIVCLNDEFIVTNTNKDLKVSVNSVKTISVDYINKIFNRTFAEIEHGNYDSAITKARTTLEEVFCYIIESENKVPSDSGKLDDLYKQVKTLLNMNNNPSLDSRVNGLLSALCSIVNNIASMRNVASDSHGLGKSRINIDKHHTRLFVNSAMILCEFVLEVYQNKKS